MGSAVGFALHEGAYIRNQWNVLDFLVVVVGYIDWSGLTENLTFLRPLICTEAYDADDNLRGFAVEGSPADCVKLALHHLIEAKKLAYEDRAHESCVRLMESFHP